MMKLRVLAAAVVIVFKFHSYLVLHIEYNRSFKVALAVAKYTFFQVFYTAMVMVFFTILLYASVSGFDTKRASQISVPKAVLEQINNQVKRIIIKEAIPTLNDTTQDLKSLVKVCEDTLNKTVESCNKCTKESCASSSQRIIQTIAITSLTAATQLLYLPVTVGVITLKVIEEKLKVICNVLGNEAKHFISQFADVAKDVSNVLLKEADSIIKHSVKGLVEFGENLAKFAEDIGKGLTKSLDVLAKGAVHISKQVLDSIKDVGTTVQKAAEHTIKEATKAVGHITNQVGKLASDAGKAVHHVANEAGKAVHHVVRSVGRFVRRIFRGWGKRSLREKRLLKECQKVCPSCIKLDNPDATQTLTKVCGADHTKKQSQLLRKIKVNQRLLNITLTATENIVTMVTYDPTAYNFTAVGVVYTGPVVTLNITGSISRFVSSEPFNPMMITPFAKEIIEGMTKTLVI